jgi:hypothetical protein
MHFSTKNYLKSNRYYTLEDTRVNLVRNRPVQAIYFLSGCHILYKSTLLEIVSRFFFKNLFTFVDCERLAKVQWPSNDCSFGLKQPPFPLYFFFVFLILILILIFNFKGVCVTREIIRCFTSV